MSETNVHGLSRYIPSDKRREVRKRCGFGCVICGSAIVEYEHIDPLFIDAREHNSAGIALLCVGCHGRVTKGTWSKAKVVAANKSPHCLAEGFTHDQFDLGPTHPAVAFAGNILSNCQTPIEVNGRPLFSIKNPEENGAPFRLSGYFTDSQGTPSLEIEDNIWTASSNQWDIEVTGPRLIIREGHRKIHLILKMDPPRGIEIEQIEMAYGGYYFCGDKNALVVTTPTGGKINMTRNICDNCRVGFSFN